MSPLLTKVDVEFVELFTVEFVSMLLLQLMHCSEDVKDCSLISAVKVLLAPTQS